MAFFPTHHSQKAIFENGRFCIIFLCSGMAHLNVNREIIFLHFLVCNYVFVYSTEKQSGRGTILLQY